ncbi:MAG: hypothetical protein R8P61_16510 [Bacteroidia bacterium]|nr:hypothetical protein [Bacteroidia bacterium]
MKKNLIITLTATILLTISPLFQACSQEEVGIEQVRNEEILLFQTEIQELFSHVSEAMRGNTANKASKLKEVFKNVLWSTYESQDSFDSFDLQYKRMSTGSSLTKASEYTELQKLIYSFDTYEEAVSKLNQKLEEGQGNEVEQQTYVVMIGILNLFNEHPDEFEKFFRTKGEGEKRAKKCGWWESWGECASGIIGGALEGIVGGCTSVGGTAAIVGAIGGPFTAAKGAVVGCIGGGVVGAVYGGLNGATGNCDGCGE